MHVFSFEGGVLGTPVFFVMVCATVAAVLPTKIFQELCYIGTIELYNIRMYHTYIDEDCIGTLKGLCRKVHRRLLELRVLLRWMLRLHTHAVKSQG